MKLLAEHGVELDVNTIEIREGDVLVVTSDMKLHISEREAIRKTLLEHFPGTKSIVLDRGFDLAVVRKEALDA
jgi:hypothetical protein